MRLLRCYAYHSISAQAYIRKVEQHTATCKRLLINIPSVTAARNFLRETYSRVYFFDFKLDEALHLSVRERNIIDNELKTSV